MSFVTPWKIVYSWSGTVSVSPALILETSRISKALVVMVVRGVASEFWNSIEAYCGSMCGLGGVSSCHGLLPCTDSCEGETYWSSSSISAPCFNYSDVARFDVSL